jgi:hypothetical protein
MMKIKMKYSILTVGQDGAERIRVVDFMSDFDNLRHGKISCNEFRRAIKVLYSDLTEADEEICRRGPTFTRGICEVLRFSRNRIRLETAPLEDPGVFNVYSNGWQADPVEPVLLPEEDLILRSVMRRLNARILTRRVDALAYMEDYDFVKEGITNLLQERSPQTSSDLF